MVNKSTIFWFGDPFDDDSSFFGSKMQENTQKIQT